MEGTRALTNEESDFGLSPIGLGELNAIWPERLVTHKEYTDVLRDRSGS